MAAHDDRTFEPATRLVIAYAFAPYADTSAVAATKRVATQGYAVDVISNAMDRIRRRDASLSELASILLRRHASLPTETMFGGWSSILSFVRAGQRTIKQWGQEPAGIAYRSVYSRAHFIASNFLAAALVGEHTNWEWEAEISDPLSRDALGSPRKGPVPRGALAEELAALLARRGIRMDQDATVFKWAETLPYVLANEVVFTSEGQRDYCLSYVDDDRVRTRLESVASVSPHVTLPTEWYEHRPPALALDPGRVHVGYFGSFYSSQDPRSLLGAIAELGARDRERLRLHVFTSAPDSLRDSVAVLGIGDVVRLHGQLPFLDFLATSRTMDLLLAVDAAPPAGSLSSPVRLSKMSDYLGSGVPIWGITAEGSELDKEALSLRTPLGHRTAARQAWTSLARTGVRPPELRQAVHG